jgi:hypothetical protein
MTPPYVVVPCGYCDSPHFLVVRNIETSRARRALGSFTTESAAQAMADDLARRLALRRALRNLRLAATDH